MATSTSHEIDSIPAIVFNELITVLRGVIGNVAGRVNGESRQYGGDYLQGSRLASCAFWMAALGSCQLDRRQTDELRDLSASFVVVASLASVRPGTDDLRAVLGNKLSAESTEWSMKVWRAQLPTDASAEFERRLSARLKKAELEKAVEALRAQEEEATSRPSRISLLQDEIKRLSLIAEGGDSE
jgi:hypothetical protein